MKDNSNIKGHIAWELRDANGEIKTKGEHPNLITAYMDTVTAYMVANGVAGSVIGYMGLGSGTGQTAASVDLARYIDILALSGAGGLQAGSNIVYSAFWGAGAGTGSIYEAGLFQTSGTTRNTMCTYNDAIRVNKGASDTLKIDWTVTFA